HSATERVAEHSLSEIPDEFVLSFEEDSLHFRRPAEPASVWKFAVGVHRLASNLGTPKPDGIEIFEAHPERVHACMAAGAFDLATVEFHLLAEAEPIFRLIARRKNLDHRRWWWRRRPEEFLHHPLAAERQARSARVAGEREDGAHGDDAAAVVIGEVHPPEPITLNASDSVVFRQRLVRVGVVAIENIRERTVFAEQRLE